MVKRKRTNNDMLNTTPREANDRATRISLKTGNELGCFGNSQFPNNVIIIKTKVLLPQA